VLFSEGSSLSARQALSALGPLGYRIDVCDPNPLCLSRFSRFVRRFHRSPALGTDPAAYLHFIVGGCCLLVAVLGCVAALLTPP
jgi:hypothetical protein